MMQCIYYSQAQNSFVGKLEGSGLDFSSSRAELAQAFACCLEQIGACVLPSPLVASCTATTPCCKCGRCEKPGSLKEVCEFQFAALVKGSQTQRKQQLVCDADQQIHGEWQGNDAVGYKGFRVEFEAALLWGVRAALHCNVMVFLWVGEFGTQRFQPENRKPQEVGFSFGFRDIRAAVPWDALGYQGCTALGCQGCASLGRRGSLWGRELWPTPKRRNADAQFVRFA